MTPENKSLLISPSRGSATSKTKLFSLIISPTRFRPCGTVSICGATRRILIWRISQTTGMIESIVPRTVMGAQSLLVRALSRTIPKTPFPEIAWSKSISRPLPCIIRTFWITTRSPGISSTLFQWDTVCRTPLTPETNPRFRKTREISLCSRSSMGPFKCSNSPFSIFRQTMKPRKLCWIKLRTRSSRSARTSQSKSITA